MGSWLEANDFSGITLFGQDWGGLIGLRLVVNHPQRFDRVVVSNTGLPYNPDVDEAVVRQIEDFRANAPTPSLIEMQKAIRTMREREHFAMKFAHWQKFCWEHEDLPIGFMMSMMMERQSNLARALRFLLYRAGVQLPFPTSLAKAYDAPFPDSSFKMGPRAMPSHVPTLPTSPSLLQQRKAWEFFDAFEKPFLCAFSDNDPVTGGMQEAFMKRVPGAKGLPHATIRRGGHFVQEIAPEPLSKAIIELIRTT